jgi:predicted SnoaL-like aldol condensation-catalyzing enzyme
MTDAPEQHKSAARAVFDVWNDGELDRLDTLVSADVVHHDPQDPNAAEGRDGMKRTIAETRERFPDIQLTVEEQLAEGDLVATRWSGEMTSADQRVLVSGITIDRFVDGSIAEAWRSYRVEVSP